MVIYNKHLLSTCRVLGTMLSALLGLFFLIFTHASLYLITLPILQVRKLSLEKFSTLIKSHNQ